MTSPALLDVDDVRAAVDARLGEVVDGLEVELAHVGAGAMTDELRASVAGGKRLRAAFCYWSWRAHLSGAADDAAGIHGTGADADAQAAGRATVLGVGAALELFQAAALVHDDVMDDSDTRRGRPATHRVFAAVHAERGWVGASSRFGAAAAILLGDLALIAADRAFAAAVDPLGPAVRAAAYRVYDLMRAEVIVGQYRDVLAQALPWGEPEAEEAQARTVVRAKSARYSVEHPIVLGAILAGADGAAVDLAARAGLALGEAFQLRDDVLGVFGDPATTGKPAGDDLREGKRTVLVARALLRADDSGRATLRDSLGRPDLTDADVQAVREVLRGTGALAEVEALIDELAGPALDALASAPLAEPGRTMLGRLGRAAVDRLA